MTADVAVLPHEDAHSYEQLREALIEIQRPVGIIEQMLVETVVINYWRLLRARRVETESLDLHIRRFKSRNGMSQKAGKRDDTGIAAALIETPDELRSLERYQNTIERSYHRALESLRKAQNDRLRQEQRIEKTQKIGFVSKAKAAGSSVDQTPPPQGLPEPYMPLTNFQLFPPFAAPWSELMTTSLGSPMTTSMGPVDTLVTG
jgi:hypothetical protein